MVIDRRTFLQVSGFAAAGPALFSLSLLARAEPSQAPQLSPRSNPPQPAVNTNLFKIDGWDSSSDIPVDSSLAADGIGDSTNDPVLIKVTRSWRASWR
jgi:hypothetical protein